MKTDLMNDIVRRLSDIVDEYSARFQQADQSVFSFKPSPGKWSKKEILGHLVDSAQNNIQRFIRVQYESAPDIVYNQDKWVSANHYQQCDLQDIVKLWTLLNKQVCMILENFPAGADSLECYFNGELHSVSFVAEDYITHLLHHLEQITNQE